MTEILNADPWGIRRAVHLLSTGELVVFGTETVYGLGADAQNAAATAAIFEAKGRPRFNPLICHYESAAAAFWHVEASGMARRLAEAFWPGPLTLVLPRRASCPVALLAGAGLDTLAVRVPNHPVALAIIGTLARPVAAPSANRSGGISPTTAAHVLADLDGRVAAIVDTGPCGIGVESTVLDLSGAAPLLLRPGGVGIEALEAVIGRVHRGITPGQAESSRAPRSPGLLASHYAPALPLRINAAAIEHNEALLAFGPPIVGAKLAFQLSERRDVAEAAAKLFEGLHWLDANAPAYGLKAIAAMPVPDEGLGLAINDRLTRAAAPR